MNKSMSSPKAMTTCRRLYFVICAWK